MDDHGTFGLIQLQAPQGGPLQPSDHGLVFESIGGDILINPPMVCAKIFQTSDPGPSKIEPEASKIKPRALQDVFLQAH